MDLGFRRAVVTGGAGFLGQRVSRRLLDQGTDVVCVDNLLEPFDVPGKVDLVMHLASPADRARYRSEALERGGQGTRNALELAAGKGARFVLASTRARPRGAYDEATRYAEALTAAYRRAELADTAIARIFSTYGSGMRTDDGRMVPTFARQALRGEPVTVAGDGTQTRSLCHVDDTVTGLVLLAASDLGGPVNIGNPDEAPVGEIARRIIGLVGSSSPICYSPRPVDDLMSRKPDITVARLALGFEPRVPWREGLAETIDWFRRITTEPRALPTAATG